MTSPEERSRTAEVLRRMEEQFSGPRTLGTHLPTFDSATELFLVWGTHPKSEGIEASTKWLSAFVDPRPEAATEDREASRLVSEDAWWNSEVAWVDSVAGAPTRRYEVARRLAEKAVSRVATERNSGEKTDETLGNASVVEEMLSDLADTESPLGEGFDQRTDQRVRLDLEYVWKRLSLIFSARQSRIWLESSNSNVGGRPIDALYIGNTALVIHALDVEEQASFG